MPGLPEAGEGIANGEGWQLGNKGKPYIPNAFQQPSEAGNGEIASKFGNDQPAGRWNEDLESSR